MPTTNAVLAQALIVTAASGLCFDTRSAKVHEARSAACVHLNSAHSLVTVEAFSEATAEVVNARVAIIDAMAAATTWDQAHALAHAFASLMKANDRLDDALIDSMLLPA